ncbi:complement C1q-like protein 2 [Sphaeramia orbicularis]|uniref:complement C1q-like protein 2 n=1 Tax=Sphaeramia orbicularis TaxID=375764 RepID=UPI00117F0B54|nr:complement C1q-like protein 2 [Sphaeramia orbicularis]
MIRAVVFLSLLAAAHAQFGWNGPKPSNIPTVAPQNQCSEQASCTCCLMLQRVHDMRTHFNNSLNDLEKATEKTMKALMDFKEKRVAFSAGLYKGFRCTTKSTSDQIAMYETVFINMGEGYDVDTGVFTAPVSGVYSITVTVYSDAGSENSQLHACAQLHVNGMTVAGASEQNTHDQEDSVSIVVARELNEGDEVSVNLPAGCMLCDDSHYNTFSAFLLYANY